MGGSVGGKGQGKQVLNPQQVQAVNSGQTVQLGKGAGAPQPGTQMPSQGGKGMGAAVPGSKGQGQPVQGGKGQGQVLTQQQLDAVNRGETVNVGGKGQGQTLQPGARIMNGVVTPYTIGPNGQPVGGPAYAGGGKGAGLPIQAEPGVLNPDQYTNYNQMPQVQSASQQEQALMAQRAAQMPSQGGKGAGAAVRGVTNAVQNLPAQGGKGIASLAKPSSTLAKAAPITKAQAAKKTIDARNAMRRR